MDFNKDDICFHHIELHPYLHAQPLFSAGLQLLVILLVQSPALCKQASG